MPLATNMTSKFETDFCNGSFWDTSMIWESQHPDFTKCFQTTILCWIPFLLILMFGILEVPRYFSSSNPNRKIPWSYLNAIKCGANVSLIIVNIAELILIALANHDDDDLTNVYPVDYVSATIYLLSYVISLLILWLSLRYGIRTSPTLFMFYLVTVICEGISFRSVVRRKTHPEENVIAVSEEGTDSLLWLLSFQYGFIITLFISNFFADKEPIQYDEKLKNVSNLSPEMTASFPSKLTFFWASSLMWKGYKNPLESSMLWSMSPRITSKGIVPVFDAKFQEEVQKIKTKSTKEEYELVPAEEEMSKPNISILWPMIKTFGPEFFLGSCNKFCHDLLVMMTPQIMSLLIGFVETKYCDPSEDEECKEDEKMYAYDWKGYFFAGLLLATTLTQSILLNQYFVRMYMVSMKIRTALISAIYRKALVMSNSARKESTVGEIVNLMSVDVQRFMVSL